MGAIQNSINQALGVAAALNAPTKALKEQEERQAAAKEAERLEAIEREKTKVTSRGGTTSRSNNSIKVPLKSYVYISLKKKIRIS